MDQSEVKVIPENYAFANLCLFTTAWMLPSVTGYHYVSVNPLTPVLQTTFNETYIDRYKEPMSESTWRILLTINASILVVGALVGGYSCNFLMRIIPNRQFARIAHVLNIIAVLIIALIGGLTGSYEAFIVGRFLTGINCGFSLVVMPSIISEMSARNKLDFWQSITGIAFSNGLLIGSINFHSKVLGSLQRWPIAIALAVIPSLIYLIVSIKIPDTPYYLMRNERKDEAIKVLKMLRVNKNVESELEIIEKELSHGTDIVGIIEVLKTKQYRNQLFAVCLLYFHSMFTGLSHVVFYSDLVFIKAGLSPEIASYATIGICGLQFATGCCGAQLINIFGAWKVCIVAALLIILGLMLFTVSQATAHLAPTAMSYFAIVSLAIILAAWSGGTNPSAISLSAELTMERTRPTCLSYASIVLWSACWIVGFVPPYMQITLKAYSMIVWLVATIMCLVYIAVFIPNTKGKSVEEIQAKLTGTRIKCMN